MWMIGELLLLLLVVSQMCVLSAYMACIFFSAQPALIFTQNHHTIQKTQRTVCTRSIMVGKGGYLGKGSRNLEICRHGDHCIE